MADEMSESTQLQRLSFEGSLVLLKFVLKCLGKTQSSEGGMCGYVTGTVGGGGGQSVAPTTPPQCVNEKERGQEESTTEVLTEGNKGLRLHLFWPSTLPAGPRRRLSLLLASVMGAGASASSGARRASSSLAGERQETLEAPSAEGSPRSLWPTWGKGVRRASAAKARGSGSGGARRGTSHVTCQLVRLSLL